MRLVCSEWNKEIMRKFGTMYVFTFMDALNAIAGEDGVSAEGLDAVTTMLKDTNERMFQRVCLNDYDVSSAEDATQVRACQLFFDHLRHLVAPADAVGESKPSPLNYLTMYCYDSDIVTHFMGGK